MMTMTRRSLLKQGAMAAAFLRAQRFFASSLGVSSMAEEKRKIASGPFQPTWQSLKQYQTPDWFRDAKFGIWAHWSPQCVPEAGDWYARHMYVQGHPQYEFHAKTYGHPTRFGFMEIDNLWKAEKWNPEELMQLYAKAGAKYFMSLANHHDNFDCFNSRYHSWNSTRIGPKKDIVGVWAKAARKHGLRFGVSNHSAHAWHWLQTAYGYDAEGQLAGMRYDAYRLRKEDGKGKWWEGLDPQELYTGPNMVIPDGLRTMAEAEKWHEANDRKWTEDPPANNPAFVEKWFLRCQDLLDSYQPDLLYFDNTELPLGQAGLDIVAHYYNSDLKRRGKLEAVVFAKNFKPEHLGATVLDIERGKANSILPSPWQTDTCIGDWHYKRSIYENHSYKKVDYVIKTLIDIVSKNGNLLLSIPVRGDGSIDEDERQFLENLAGWMQVNGEAIFGTRPYSVYGEGLPDVSTSSDFNEGSARPLGAEDIRYVVKGDILYAFLLGWPASGKVMLRSLALTPEGASRRVNRVELLGNQGNLRFQQKAEGLEIQLPPDRPNPYAYAFRIV